MTGHGTLPQLSHFGCHELHCELGEAGLGAVAVVFLWILKTGTKRFRNSAIISVPLKGCDLGWCFQKMSTKMRTANVVTRILNI